mmetsp:Transcript_85055/g.186745  ORF Transcript_85055/g.186745 Transcript_85055/m.186745 type:complete len:198 (-) Transcript_85055:384-977(-)
MAEAIRTASDCHVKMIRAPPHLALEQEEGAEGQDLATAWAERHHPERDLVARGSGCGSARGGAGWGGGRGGCDCGGCGGVVGERPVATAAERAALEASAAAPGEVLLAGVRAAPVVLKVVWTAGPKHADAGLLPDQVGPLVASPTPLAGASGRPEGTGCACPAVWEGVQEAKFRQAQRHLTEDVSVAAGEPGRRVQA